MCYADPICQAIEWKNGADCRLFDNQNDSGPQHSGYHVYKLARQVPDAIWSGALASDIPEYGYAQYSDVADVDVCKAMCYADPICQAIEWKNGADCRLFDNQNDSGPQHSGYHVYKLTRQVPAVLPSLSPTISPISSEPTPNPTPDPTRAPSKSPSFGPTPSPTSQPTVDPTKAPSKSPSSSPSTSPTAGDFIIKVQGFVGDPQDFIDWEMANREQPRMNAYQFNFVRQLKQALPKSTCSATTTRAFELSSDLTGTGVTLIAYVNFAAAAYNDRIDILKQQSDVCGLSAGQNGWMHLQQFNGEMLYCICGRGCVSTILPESGSGSVA